MDRLLTIKEVAELLSISTKTLRTWDNEGKLKAIKTVGGHRKYLESDIENFLNKNVVINVSKNFLLKKQKECEEFLIKNKNTLNLESVWNYKKGQLDLINEILK